LVESEEQLPKPIPLDKDLGYMLYDIDFKHDMTPVFFRAQLEQGILRMDEKLKGRVNA